MENTDFSFMKSGFDPISHNKIDNENELAFTSLFMAFTQNSLVRAGKYTEHNNRRIVTLNDIRNGLKVETFKFLETDNSKTISDWKKYLENINNEDDVEDCDDDCDEDEDCDDDCDEDEDCDDNMETEDDAVKTCNCDDCNEFYNIDGIWNNWVPEEGIPQLLKEHIDKNF